MKIRPLKNVGVEIFDLDLASLSKKDYQEIAEVFFSELMVLFRAENTSVLPFAKLVASFGEIVNKGQCIWNKEGERVEPMPGLDPFNWSSEGDSFPVQRVTGKKIDGAPTGIFGSGILDWHCNINGVTWAPGVGLQAVAGVEGTQTSWMDTTRAYDDLSDELKLRCENVIGHFSYSPAVWAEGLPDWQLKGMLSGAKPGGYRMKLVNTSERGRKGLYFHFLNDCKFPTDPELLQILKRHCFQEKYIQRIDWRPGDIHISHQILTLHRREQSDPEILAERVLHRYTFDFSKYYPEQKPLYL
jgi:alpha-ketoglutarate-dependent taurine dioxygenase